MEMFFIGVFYQIPLQTPATACYDRAIIMLQRKYEQHSF